MAESKIKGSPIRYIDVTKGNIKIPSDKYYILTSSWHPTPPEGYRFAFAVMYKAAYTGEGTDDALILESDGNTLIGTPGKTYNSVTIRYFYI